MPGWQGLAEPVSVALQVYVWDVALPASTAVQTQLFDIHMGQVARYCGLDPQPTSPQWADAVAQCVNLYRNYRISPAHAAFADLSGRYRPSVVLGRLGKAARFDGYVTRLALPLPPRLVEAPEFTLMCWFRPTRGDPRTQFILSSWHQGQGLRLEYRGGQSVAFYGRQTEPVARHAEMAAPVAAGEWHHVAVVREGGTPRLYLDGVQEGELPDSPRPTLYQELLLGTYPFMNESLYSGDLDEVRALDRALDASAIRREMRASAQASEAPVKRAFDAGLMGYPSPCSPEGASLLRAWWQFWRSEGLHLGNVTAPGAYKWDHVDFRTAKAFFDAFYPWLEGQGWLPYSYTRMPVDEALAGRGREVNVSYGRWLGENCPEVNRHHTIGDAIEDERFDDVMQYAGLIDIWDFTPGVWQDRGQRTVAALARRRREHGDRFAWYMTRSSPVLRNGVPLRPLDLRGFFWQMMKHDVTMVSHWAVNLWDPPTGKHSDRDLQWFEQERCYRFRRSTAAGVASATFLWPSASGPLPSIRWAAIRDGIEDFDLWWLVKQGAERAAREGVQVQGLDELRARVDGAPLRIVGLLGFSTDFGGDQAFRDLRAELAQVAVRLHEAGLLPEADPLPPPPQPVPWRWFVDQR